MKKLLSALATAAFMSTAYAGSLTIGAQINPYIKYTNTNEKADAKLFYDVDWGKDTKAFLIYNDKDVTGKLVLITPDQTVKVGVALLKLKNMFGTPVYMILGKQPNLPDMFDISVTHLYTLDVQVGKVPAVTVGMNINPLTIQGTVINPYDTTYVVKQWEIAGIANLKGVGKFAASFDYSVNLGKDNNAYLAYAYGETSILPIVKVQGQVSYSSQKLTENDTAKIYTIATTVSLKQPMKLLFKLATPYVSVQYSNGNANSGISYEDAIKAGLKIKYSPNVVHNDYVEYTASRVGVPTTPTTWITTTSVTIGSDWIIKFAKTIK